MREYNKKFNPKYATPVDVDHSIQEKAKSMDFLRKSQDDFKERADRLATPLIIDDVKYESVAKAARILGLSDASIKKRLKELEKSSRSEMEFSIQCTKTFTFKKVQQ